MPSDLAGAESRIPACCAICAGGASGASSATSWDTACDKATATTAGGIDSLGHAIFSNPGARS
jgi:hypothetical protein